MTPRERLVAAIEVLLCSGFPTQLLLIGFLAAIGLPFRTPDGNLSPAFVFALSLLDTVLLVGFIFAFLHVHAESPRRVLLGLRPPGREALLGVVLIPAVFLFVIVIMALVLGLAPELRNVPENPFEDLMQTPRDAVIFGFVAMLAGGVREEIQRAFILHRFDGYLGGGLLGVIVFSAVFGAGHVEQGYDAMLVTGLLGAAWGVVYLRRRSVIAPIVSHAGFNLLQLVKYAALS